MRIVWRLAAAYARQHPARWALTSLAVIAAACMVVWVVSGYDALVSQFDDEAEKYLGRYDLVIVPDSTRNPVIAAGLLEALRRDPAVAEADPAVQHRVALAPTGSVPADFGGLGMGGPGDRPGRSGFGPGRGGPGGPGGLGRGGPGGPGGFGRGRGPGRPGGPGGPQLDKAAATAGDPPAAGPPAAGPGGAGPSPGRRMMPPSLVGIDAAKPPYDLASGRWIDAASGEKLEAAISRSGAEMYALKPGDQLALSAKGGDFRLTIIGTLEESSSSAAMATRRGMAPGPGRGLPASALYVRRALAERIAGVSGETHLINLVLHQGADMERFRQDWNKRLASYQPPATLFSFAELVTAMEERGAGSSAKNQAYAATGLSLLAGFFIIFATLSMGLNERVRQFAMLRAVAWTRTQVALLIASEALVLAVFGWLGGLAAGWGLLQIAQVAQPSLFPNGASLGPWCVGLAGISAFGGALAASILPAWKATRVSPLEAMSGAQSRVVVRRPLLPVLVGLALIAVNPLLVFYWDMPDESRYLIYALVGCPTMAIGFLLLVPGIVAVAERVLSPLVAAVLGVNSQLLRTQLTSNLGRTLGTTLALTSGLGLYVATQIWGYSMLGPFVPGDWVPEVLVCLPYGGLSDAEAATVPKLKGIAVGQCLPLAVEQPKLAEDITGAEVRMSVARQDNVVLIGLDPEAGLGGSAPLLNLEFVRGTPAAAAAVMKTGRGCVVPDHFIRATGLKLGDRFGLIPPEAPDKPVEYTICGVVRLPGWHWMTKMSGLRRRAGRSAAMIFAAFDDVRRDFQLEKINFFWFNTDHSLPLASIGEAIQPIAEGSLGRRQPVNDQGTWSFGAQMVGNHVRMTTAADIRARIGARADGWIWGMSRLPLVTLAVTALGVMNAIMASIRVRRWEMGVLRAVGVTRMALVRLILAEALLIGGVACLVSLAFGITAGGCGVGISQYASFFGGLSPSLVLPWAHLALGLGATLLLCLAAALWPAVATGRSEPLALLQAGRAAG